MKSTQNQLSPFDPHSKMILMVSCQFLSSNDLEQIEALVPEDIIVTPCQVVTDQILKFLLTEFGNIYAFLHDGPPLLEVS